MEQQRWWSTTYRTSGGERPLEALLDFDASAHAAVQVALEEVAAAPDLDAYRTSTHGAIHETTASVGDTVYRILFAVDPAAADVLLGLVAVPRREDTYPGELVVLAAKRLTDWTESSSTSRLD